MERLPYVAGKFYPEQADSLKSLIESYIEPSEEKVKISGIIVPHAGYVYSGKTAGSVYSKIIIPDVVVILGPNHTGMGASTSIYPEGLWRTPLGSLAVNSKIAMKIISLSNYASPDKLAHLSEHSIEVQLPFIQTFNPKASIIPISMGDYSLTTIQDLINAIDNSTQGEDVLFIASSDFSHYEPEYTAKARDKMAIEEIKKMNWTGLWQVVQDKEISICGLGPISVVIELAKRRGAKSAKLLAYTNSGVVSHDFSNVVTYAGIAFR